MKQITRQAAAGFLPPRPKKAHKGDFGRVLVVAGSRTMCGAGLLCAKSALLAGAGLVYWALPETKQPAFAAALPEAITLPLPETKTGEISRASWPVLRRFIQEKNISLLAVGPGMGPSPLLPVLLAQADLPLVADADALQVLPMLKWKKPVIVTPHPGEIARMLAGPVPVSNQERAEHVQRLARQTGAVCVLKGFHTLVAAPEKGRESLWQNTTGGPALAKAGSGDVLTGVIAGLWAQLGTQTGWTVQTGLQAAACGVYVHGLAGDLAAKARGVRGVLATDTAAYIPVALQSLHQER